MSHNFKAVIFDMDGLLVASEGVWLVAEADMIEARGREYTHEARAQIVGLRLDEFSQKIKAYYGFDDDPTAIEAEVTERMLRRIPTEVKPQPGALEIIQYVQAHNLPTAIASSSPQSIIDATIEAQGWMDIFKIRVSADIVARGKPAPDVYLKAAEILGVNPADCLALEDSPAGSRAAVAAGMTCYAVPDPTHSAHSAFDDITPHVFHNLHDVLARLQG